MTTVTATATARWPPIPFRPFLPLFPLLPSSGICFQSCDRPHARRRVVRFQRYVLHKASVLMQRLRLSFVSETVLSDRIQSCHSKTIVENHLDSDVKSRASYATLLCNVSVCPLLRSAAVAVALCNSRRRAARCLAVSPNLVRSTRLVLSYGMAPSASVCRARARSNSLNRLPLFYAWRLARSPSGCCAMDGYAKVL